MSTSIVRLLKPLTQRMIALGTLVLRPMTVGVRAAVFDEEGRVFLVRHTYLPGWYLPGGGVDPGESAQVAVARELREEGNLEATGVPRLFGLYLNRKFSRRNHVALYVIREWAEACTPCVRSKEIAAAGFFAPDDLPQDVTAATRRRLDEIAVGVQQSDIW